MIIKGSQRGGAMALAAHLTNIHDNDHVEIHSINGFMAQDVKGAFAEIQAISMATRCKQFMFSVSLSPPKDALVIAKDYEDAVQEIAEKLGLDGQPYVMLFHEKNGRKHCHAVFSRIDITQVKAINLSFYKEKLNELAREQYLIHGWELPQGFQDRSLSNPLNYSLEEYQLAKRAGRDPREIKATLKQCLQQSDGKAAFSTALQEKGFYLCKGSRRGFVALDWMGNVYSLSRWTGEKAKALKAKLGEPEQLATVEQMQAKIDQMMTDKYCEFLRGVEKDFADKMSPLEKQRQRIVTRQRNERKKLRETQQARRWQEAIARSKKLRKGLFGFWDWINGNRKKTIGKNAADIEAQKQRQQQELQSLFSQQKNDRKSIHSHIIKVKNCDHSRRADLKAEFDNWQTYDKMEASKQEQERLMRESNRDRDRFLG